MNNKDVFGEVELRPGQNLVIRSDVQGLWLSSSQDLWYSGGGAFQPWTFGYRGRPSNGQTGLATLYDISADYNWKHGISVGLYFGYAVGGPVIKKIYPNDPNGTLGYTEFNYTSEESLSLFLSPSPSPSRSSSRGVVFRVRQPAL
jgi:hypothetical protein